jgi:lipopolysaccharide biosynthesis glycosyltransferase
VSFIPKSKPNALVTCCTPNWLPLAACTLKSCVDQGAADLADLYVLALGLTDQHRAEFAAFLAKHKMHATLIEGALPEELIARAPKRFSAAAFLRLTLDQTLDPTYARVLYLDSDILALAPIAEALNYDLGGKPLGAVEDYQSFPTHTGGPAKHPQSIGLPAGARYFNSGVLLFDWPQILARKLLPECVERILALSASRKKLNFPDQDVMNLVFAGDWQRMPTRFNLISIVSDYFPEAPVFRHFTRDHKPWHKVRGIGYSDHHLLYQSMLMGTPWAQVVQAGRMRLAPFISLGNYLRSHDTKTRERYRKHLEG